MFDRVLDELSHAAFLAGGKREWKLNILESCRYAIEHEADWQATLQQVIANRPEWFDHAEGLRRRNKMKYHNGVAGGRFTAGTNLENRK